MYLFIRGTAVIYSTFLGISNNRQRFFMPRAFIAGVILFILGPIFPLFYNTTGEIRQLATHFIWVVALATPFISFTNSEYFILRSGGKTIITFLFDSCFVCLVNVPVSMCLAKFTSMNIVSMFLLVNMLEGIKSFIGFVMVKKDIWLNTIVE